MFSTEGQELKKAGVNRSFEAGVVYAHIYGAQVRTSKTGKKALEFILEGPQLPEPFEGWAIDKENPEGPKFKGQSSRVMATIYTADYESDDINKNEILNKIIVIADQLGLRKDVDAISKDKTITSIEQWVERAVDILRGSDLYWFLAGKEDQYNDKIIVRLSLPKFKFCSADEFGLNKFDRNNKYHYTPFATKAVNGFEPMNDDFNI